MQLTIKTERGHKDQVKSDQATKFIGRGSRRSSTNQYRLDWGVLANTGEYKSTDIVFISAEGNRIGRLDPDYEEINKAVLANATFITDIPSDRHRAYNIGERQVEKYLVSKGYQEQAGGIWKPKKFGLLSLQKLSQNQEPS